MPRSAQRVRLENGLKLDINRLCRCGVLTPGASTKAEYQWTIAGERFGRATLSADMRGDTGRLWIEGGTASTGFDQAIRLVSLKRHFGGRQWFFLCPVLERRAMVLWLPPGAEGFACRQRWGRAAAYTSQFLTAEDRASRAMQRLNAELCARGGYDPDAWDLPPKPKWMRWRTYREAHARFERYESAMDARINRLADRHAPAART